MYLFLFLVGFFGFVAMTALGFLHGGGARGGHHGSIGHSHGGGVKGLPSHGHGHLQSTHSHGAVRHFSAKSLLTLSPLDLFSFAIGAGAAGLLLAPVVPAAWLPFCAILGALVFNLGMVKPLMGFLLGFASNPSEGAEALVSRPAEAITKFDEQGRGLVRLTLDGQHVQLLATLESDETTKGVTVSKGDELIVLEVDPHRNVCRVTRELT